MDTESGLAAVHAAANISAPAPAGAGAALAAQPTTLVELSAAFPDLCAQIRTEGATAERTRILAIEAAALPGHEALVAQMKADPAVTADMAAGRLLNSEKQLPAGQLQAVKDVEGVTGAVTASPAAAVTRTEASAKPDAHQLAARAREYQAEQAKLGNKVSTAQAVMHVEQHG